MNPNHPTCARSTRLFALFFLLVLPALAPSPGCNGDQGGPVETGEIMLSVSSVPDNVACIRVTITGEFRSVVSDFDVASGDTLDHAFSGLPVGPVVFSASAYAQACASATKSTIPMWISEEKTVNVVQGKSSTVTLVLLKNGRAKVSVEFGDEQDGGGSPDAGAAGG